ncbi:uncharacterized protein F4822DRAFT_386570 [Hypoxylon trugodes]|uniref:uncharacterized protein n=1 Tax=Hypoxylon trugodes TaxID=326681 RepID=UPI0021914B8C|nr:uncharacterized protein F4822DRAFT_386570 [Hypoxylon trugodes]KAI1393964.1 hypothetical protein F4822DRAFT_386570 [Hypoxylon trugodes]
MGLVLILATVLGNYFACNKWIRKLCFLAGWRDDKQQRGSTAAVRQPSALRDQENLGRRRNLLPDVPEDVVDQSCCSAEEAVGGEGIISLCNLPTVDA